MNGFKVIEKKPCIVYVSSGSISKLSANYFSINRIKIIDIIKNCNIKYDTLNNRVKIKNKRKIPIGNSRELYIGLADINAVTGEISDNNVLVAGITGTSVVVEKGQILFSKLRPNLNKVTICPPNMNEAFGSTEFSVFEPKDVDGHYLFSVLKSNIGLSQVQDITAGSTLPRVDVEDVLDILIPIPSPEIQKYIGDKVRKAEELRDEAKMNEKESYKEFDNMFNFKINKSNNWYIHPCNLLDRIDCEYNYNYFFELEKNLSKQGVQVLEFGDLIARKMSEPQTDSSNFVDEGIPVLRITDIREDYLDFENCAKIPEEIYNDLKEFQLIPSDIIFGLSGTIGRAIVVPQEIPKRAITNRRIAKVTLKEPNIAYYIAMFLNSEYGKMQLLRETTGGVQKNLRLEDITKIHIPIPDRQIISKISNYINNRMRCLNTSRLLIQQAKQDIEDLIEGNFDMSKIKENN